MKKRILSVIVMAAMTLSLTACGNNSQKADDNTSVHYSGGFRAWQ